MVNQYYVEQERLEIIECIFYAEDRMIRKVNEDGTLADYRKSCKLNNVFAKREDAEIRLADLKKIYVETLRYEPYMKEEMLRENLSKLVYIEKEIEKALEGFENFEGVDFCDVNAHGVQIRGHHKEITGYTYGSQPTIKYDFSNYHEVIQEFIDMWEKADTKEKVASEKRFIRDGEKWGWD